MSQIVKLKSRAEPESFEMEMPEIHVSPAQVTVEASRPPNVTIQAPPPAQIHIEPVVKILDQRPSDEVATQALGQLVEAVKTMTTAVHAMKEELISLRQNKPTVATVIRNKEGQAEKIVLAEP